MSDGIISESDLEIVHDDWTVTDKTDGFRRPYHEHVALVRQRMHMPARVLVTSDPSTVQVTKPFSQGRHLRKWIAAAAVPATFVVWEVIRWTR